MDRTRVCLQLRNRYLPECGQESKREGALYMPMFPPRRSKHGALKKCRLLVLWLLKEPPVVSGRAIDISISLTSICAEFGDEVH